MDENEKKIWELEHSTEIKAVKFIKWLSKKVPTFIALLIAIWWIFYGTVKITPTGLSFTQKIGLTITTLVLAVAYTNLIAENGFVSGKQTNEYTNAYNSWIDSCKKGIGKQKEIIDYAKEIAANNIYEIRKGNLEAVLVKYEDIFNADGTTKLINLKKYNRNQRKIIKKCINLKINLPTIFGNISSKFFGIKKEITKNEYEARYTAWHTAIRAILSFVSAGIMFEFIGFSIGSVVYALFQIALWSGSGWLQRIRNFNFVIDTLIPQLNEKSMIINSYLEKMKGENSNVS